MLTLVTKRCEDTLYTRTSPCFTGIPRHLLSQNPKPVENNKKMETFLLQTAMMTTWKISSHSLRSAAISMFTYSLKIYWRKFMLF